MKRGIRICITVSLVLLLGANLLGGFSALAASTSVGTVKDYFPVKPNTRYMYEGSGSEYAFYDVVLDYWQGAKMQQRVDNGGTVTARVIELKNGAAKLVYTRSEVYYRENFLTQKSNSSEILLKEPLRAGTKWKLPDGRERRISSTSASVSTPSGDYKAIEVVTKSKYSTTTDYYAKGVGLVKSVFKSGDTVVSSSLLKIEKDKPFVQTIRFFYPDVNADRIKSVEKQVSFRTNDITRFNLVQAYKDALVNKATVFSKNTKINSLYLNRDGMVYIDLSRAFVTEMNAGSGVESMILQSVANTFGGYYGVQRVYLTIDNKLYQSGHIALKKGQYLKVRLDEAA